MNRTLLYHHAVQHEVPEILSHYEEISPKLASASSRPFTLLAESGNYTPLSEVKTRLSL